MYIDVYNMQVSEYIEFMDSLNPNDHADQSSLWDLAKTVRNAYALPSLGEFKDFFDDFTYFVQKKRRFGNCKSFP